MFNTVSHISTLDCRFEEKCINSSSPGYEKVAALFDKRRSGRVKPAEFAIETPKSSRSLHDKSFSNSLHAITKTQVNPGQQTQLG